MTPADTIVTTPPLDGPAFRYMTRMDQVRQLPADQRAALERVTRQYHFRASDYYLGLIDWQDPADPIRQLIVPRAEELDGSGLLDASNEATHTIARGVQHKYPDTVVLLCNETCGGFCRYCFRKRLFMNGNNEVSLDLTLGLNYIMAHPEVTNVLLTGGDPLLLSTSRLAGILGGLRAIPHVQIIRIGTKMPAFNPWRVLDDQSLQRTLSHYSTARQRIYIMTHFDHPRELTEPAIDGIDRLIRCGVICANQCPLIRGVNDDPRVLSDLYRRLSWIGCPPYYLFQMRPTAGNAPYAVPIVRGWEIFREALRYGSGLARRARFVMSHATGKIEILAVDDRHIYLRYQRAKDPTLRGRFLVYKRHDDACWLDQLVPSDTSNAPQFSCESGLEVQEGPE
jgi:KamA family protein